MILDFELSRHEIAIRQWALQDELAARAAKKVNRVRLDKENAELIASVDIRGQSQKDYAREHGVSYSTSKSRVQKSGHQLRELFEDCCYLTLDHRGNIIDCNSKSSSCKKC